MDGNKNRSGGGVHLQLLSDRPVKDYEGFFVDLMHGLDNFKIRSVAVVAILEEPTENGGDAITAYHNSCVRDRQLSAALIQEDTMYRIAADAVLDLVDPECLIEEDA